MRYNRRAIAVWVIGNGGHAKVVIEAIKAQRRYVLAGIISDSPDELPVEPGVPHIGPISLGIIERHRVASAIIGIGANDVRKRVALSLTGSTAWASVIHPSAVVSTSTTIGNGVFLSAGSIVQASVRIGNHTILNTAATVDHDSTIGDYTHIAPGSHLGGNVTVGDGVLLGVGSSVIPGITIGAGVIVGAGSVVIHDVTDDARVAGVPARIIASQC
jgi:sugar O-acyltransferase (sialic acid O-acetyltransferase NeuD family)